MLRNELLCLIAVVVALAAVEKPANGQTLAPPAVPANLRVLPGNTVFLKASAVGTQNYVCVPTASGFGWQFQAPQATVFFKLRWFNGDLLQQVITHFLSPNPMEAGMPRATWQSSIDTSAVWAKKIAESSDPSYVGPGAISWFLLQVTGSQQGPSGGSMLGRTTFIQRVNTSGGVMPDSGCTEVGRVQFVPYTAEYVFYKTIGDN